MNQFIDMCQCSNDNHLADKSEFGSSIVGNFESGSTSDEYKVKPLFKRRTKKEEKIKNTSSIRKLSTTQIVSSVVRNWFSTKMRMKTKRLHLVFAGFSVPIAKKITNGWFPTRRFLGIQDKQKKIKKNIELQFAWSTKLFVNPMNMLLFHLNLSFNASIHWKRWRCL